MKRFLLIGLDGGELSLLTPWMDAGHLPHLAALRQQGTCQALASTRPPVTFPAWTTCVTGVNPGRHGIFDFTETCPGDYAIRFINQTHRRVPALWNILDGTDKRSCVLGVPGTYPPEPLNGVMVSGFDSPVCTGVDRSFVYPAARYSQVKDWRFADFQEHHIGPGWHAAALEKLLTGIESKTRCAEALLAEEPWDFFMMVYGESDTVSHHFWLFHDVNSPRHRPGFEDAILRIYQKLDAAVGRLMAAAGEEVVVGIVSDHGFGGAGTGVVHLNNWLAEEGYLQWREGGRESLLKQWALSLTPESWRGALFRRFGGLAAKAESQARFGRIDWAHTLAWSEELNYFPSIRLNLAGREPEGQVRPEDYEAVVAELCDALNAWEPVARAVPRGACYDGPETERAPDIIVELALEAGYSPACLRSTPGGPVTRRLEEDEYLGGKERGMNGTHRDAGILLLSEPTEVTDATLMDIAPTVLSVLGVSGPAMEGRALLGEGHGARTVKRGVAPTAYTPEEEAMVAERMRALGYYE